MLLRGRLVDVYIDRLNINDFPLRLVDLIYAEIGRRPVRLLSGVDFGVRRMNLHSFGLSNHLACQNAFETLTNDIHHLPEGLIRKVAGLVEIWRWVFKVLLLL